MVWAVLVAGPDPTSPDGVAASVAVFYTAEGNDARRPERTAFLLHHVHQQAVVAGRTAGPNAVSDAAAGIGVTTGIFRIASGPFNAATKTVCWTRNLGFLWVLVAEDYESTFQVREMLLALVALIQEHARATATTADPQREAFSHLDDILALLNAYMPNGMLLIANQSFARNTRRDLEGQLQRT